MSTESAGWAPGVPGAARTKPLSALVWGVRRTAASKAAVVTLWAIGSTVAQALMGHRLDRVIEFIGTAKFAWLASPDFWLVLADRLDVTGGGGDARVSLAIPLFVLLQLFLAGGAINYLHTDRRRPFALRFAAAGGNYLGRFVRLMSLWSLLYVLVLRQHQAVTHALHSGAFAASHGMLTMAHSVLSLLLVILLTVALDFAMVRTVMIGSRSMLIEALRSLAFVFRHLPRVALLAGVLVGAGFTMLGLLSLAWQEFNPAAASYASVLIQALAMFGCVWLRHAAWASEISLYRGLTAVRLGTPGVR